MGEAGTSVRLPICAKITPQSWISVSHRHHGNMLVQRDELTCNTIDEVQ
jgi:hypothetical protein